MFESYSRLYISEDEIDVIEMEYDPDSNTFYDEWGVLIPNIFDLLTPNDLYLFKNDYDNNMFNHKKDKKVVCVIGIRGEQRE